MVDGRMYDPIKYYDRQLRGRRVVRRPNWLRRIPVGDVRAYELVVVESVGAEFATVLIGDASRKHSTVARVRIRNPFAP